MENREIWLADRKTKETERDRQGGRETVRPDVRHRESETGRQRETDNGEMWKQRERETQMQRPWRDRIKQNKDKQRQMKRQCMKVSDFCIRTKMDICLALQKEGLKEKRTRKYLT